MLFGFCFAIGVVLLAVLDSGSWLSISSRLLLRTTIYHILLEGSFFALAYVLGERSGGPRGGALASAVEGIGGYTGFLLWILLRAGG